MAFTASHGLPDEAPLLASSLSIEKTKEKYVIQNRKGTSALVHQFDPQTKYSMTVEAIDSAIEPGDGAALAIPGLPDEGYNALDSVKLDFTNTGNAKQSFDGVVYPEGAALVAEAP